MGKRFAIVIGAAALGAALIAVGASATFRSVDDPRGDAKCYHDRGRQRPCSGSAKRNADIVRATAGHEGRWLKHTIRVVGKFQQGGLLINTASDRECEFRLFAPGSKVRECGLRTRRPPQTRVDIHRHSVEISFSKRSIGFPRFYGWWAYANDGPGAAHAVDDVPRQHAVEPLGTYIRHWLR